MRCAASAAQLLLLLPMFQSLRGRWREQGEHRHENLPTTSVQLALMSKWQRVSGLWQVCASANHSTGTQPADAHRNRNWRDRLDFSITSSSVTVSRPPSPAAKPDVAYTRAGKVYAIPEFVNDSFFLKIHHTEQH